MARALIIEDHPLFAEALGLTLTGYVGLSEVERVDHLGAALDRLALAPAPDVIVLDLHLPDVTGLDGLARVIAAARGVPVVVVSSLNEPRVIEAAMQLGAAGFVPKHAEREAFRSAFGQILSGQPLPQGGAAPHGPERPRGSAADLSARMALLTRQQARILQLLCLGKLNKQIAFDLSIAEPTVKAHVTAIMRKLGVQSRTQAVLLAARVDFDRLLSEARPGP